MNSLRSTLRGAVLLAALITSTSRLHAQMTTGSIAGRVTGAQGEPLENVQVQVVNGATGMTIGSMTRTDGRYLVAGLEIGDQYRVTARRIGFAPQTVQPVRVNLGQTATVNITLSAQAAQLEAVTITADAQSAAALISSSQKGANTTITDTLLRKLPSLSRNFTDFVVLTPQVSTSGPGLSAGGANNRYNNIQIDGATEKDLFGLGSTGQPGGQAGGKSIGLEAVKEYQVLLAPYDVRVGNFAGLSVNAVTKSGTNDFHGSAYVYQRTDDFQPKKSYLGNFYATQYGVGIGGPILKDKAFFYINPEWQKKAAPASGPFLGSGTNSGLTQGLIDQFTSALAGYGMNDLGNGGKVSNQNPLSNLFVRFDLALPWNSTLVLRENYAHAEQQVFSRTATTASATPNFGLTSNSYQFASDKHAPVAQLRTNFANGSYNELIAGYTRIRDSRATPGTLQPQVTVLVNGTAALIAGTEQSSQANELDQDVVELTDNYTIPLGSTHRLTVGAQGQWYKVRNLFGQNLVGAWIFTSMDSLALGRPRQYDVGVPVTGDGAVRFKAGQFAGYLQDDWTATPNLNMSFGLRFDAPVFFDKPPYNAVVDTTFGRNTSDVPTGNLQVSPRFGFNWNVTGDSKNQIRGGLGVFQGSPAYVWLSNSFQNSGGVSGFASLRCSTPATAPQFTAAAVASAPAQCSNGTTATAGAEVDLLRKDLKFPQTMRGNLAYDRDVGHGFVVGVEGIYTRFLNSLFYTNIALQDAPIGTSVDGRSLYGNQPATPSLKVAGRSSVYDVSNQSKDYSYSLTGSVQKRFTQNLGGSFAYTFTQAYDLQSLTSSTAGSQYRFGRVYSGAQTELNLAHSAFETPHRIVANASYTLPTRTSLSVIYTGQSGMNFAYVSSTDLNGDNVTSNDPIYIPTGLDDPLFPVFLPTASITATTAEQSQAFNDFISNNSCLNKQRGSIMERNSCRTPWTNQFDVSIEQGLKSIIGQEVSLRLDVINFGNWLNHRWGHQITTSNFNPVAIYNPTAMVLPGTNSTTSADLTNAIPRASFNPSFNPFNYDNVFSNYGMQLSLRYSF